MENIEMKNKAVNIQNRTFDFACRVVRLYKYMIKQDRSNEVLCKQLVRAGTSIGANLEEADAAQSRADFISKCNIALKEARESNYWLRLYKRTKLLSEKQLKDILQESHEIVSILTTIVKKSRARSQ
jgi:four helix bundle protein